MQETKEKILEVLKDGNKQLLYFLFIFIFIHLVIIIPFKHPVENNSIGQATKIIKNQISYLNSSLAKLENRNNNPITLDAKPIREKVDSLKGSRDSLIDQQIYLIREKLMEYQKADIDISKQREERSFSIPILGISIKESVILSVYPGFILVWLSLALIYRRKLLQLVLQLPKKERNDFTFPVWAAPVPLSLWHGYLGPWLIVNVLGISIHCLIVYVGLDFLLFRGNQFSFELLALNIFIAIIAIAVYLTTVIQLIKFEWNRIEK
jgi:hypothetical protein